MLHTVFMSLGAAFILSLIVCISWDIHQSENLKVFFFFSKKLFSKLHKLYTLQNLALPHPAGLTWACGQGVSEKPVSSGLTAHSS